MTDLRIAIAGAGGQMGAANVRAFANVPGIEIVAAFDRAGAPAIGIDAGAHAGIEALGVTIGDDAAAALTGADAIVDFTAPSASVALAKLAAKQKLIHIIGTTGCTADDDAAIAAAAKAGARIVKSGNFSLGVNLLANLVRQAAQALGPDWDIEIVEMHHNRKVDAPSGTALLLGKAAAAGRNIALDAHSARGRDGHTGARKAGDIGFAALRGGNVIGDHTVMFAGPTERIELTHRAEDRSLFAQGAVRAALWVRNQKPGLYDMADVLGLKE
jgi:4-hydroxy-tetrahydrodipicolinate reductase